MEAALHFAGLRVLYQIPGCECCGMSCSRWMAVGWGYSVSYADSGACNFMWWEGRSKGWVGQHGETCIWKAAKKPEDYGRSQSSCLWVPTARSGKICDYCVTGLQCELVLVYFSRGESCESWHVRDTGISEISPGLSKSSVTNKILQTKKWHQYFLRSNYSVHGAFKGCLQVREWPWSQTHLLVTALIQEGSPISWGTCL